MDWYTKGYALYDQGKYDEAAKAYDEAIRLDPNNADTWYNKGLALYDQGKYDEATKAYDEAIRLDPNNADTWNNKGNSLSHLGKYDDAINAYDEATRLDPNDAYAWYNKGNSLYDQGKYDEAIKAYDEAIRLDPNDASTWYNKGNSLYNQGKYDEAVKAYDEALGIDPNYTKAQNGKADALEKIASTQTVTSSAHAGTDWQKANGGWIVIKNNHQYGMGGPFQPCPGQTGCRGFPLHVVHGVCINAVTFADTKIGASWTAPADNIIQAHDCGTNEWMRVSCPVVTEYWVPAGTYNLTEFNYVSEVNPGFTDYIPCDNAWSKPSIAVVIKPGDTVDFGESILIGTGTCKEGGYNCGTGTGPKCGCTITAPSSVCSFSTDNMASVPATSGATYTWSIIGGTITAGTGTRAITWTAGDRGQAYLSIKVTSNNCSKTCTKDVIVEAPDCTITAPSSVCSGSTGNTASVEDAGEGATYDWSITGGSITSGAETDEITWTAREEPGTVQISVKVTDSNGCSATCTEFVTVIPSPGCTIDVVQVSSGSTGNRASVEDAGEGATYDWSITGGSITSGAETDEITWTAGDGDTAHISVKVTNNNGCSATCTKDVTVTSTVAAGGPFYITNVEYPKEVVVNGPRGTLTVYWTGDPVFPIKMAIRPTSCPSGAYCTTPEMTFDIEQNPLVFPESIWCTGSGGNYWGYEVVLIDARGVESDPYPTPFTC